MKRIKAAGAVLALAIVLAGIAGCSAKEKHDTPQTRIDYEALSEMAREGKGAKAAAGASGETSASTSAEASAEASPGTQAGDSGAGHGKGETDKKIPDPIAKDGDKILFVGNSHTYANDLPGVFYEMALAGGHEVEVYDLTEGAYTLRQFSDPEDELGEILTNALQSEPWNFVVLQENTNAALDFNAKKDMYPYARKLDQMIKAAGGQTAFLMTWAPKNGAGLFSHKMAQDELSSGYRTIAGELDALLIPGGEIFDDALKQDEKLELWGEDGQHPSEEGTYLAACAAYAMFFQETPVGNPYLADLEGNTAQVLQKIAYDVMMGNGG